jgi:hypothetical protein
MSDAIKQAIEALIECLSTLSDFGLESSDAYQQVLAALQAMQGEADTKTHTNLCQKNAEPVAWMVTTERYGKPHTYPVQGEYKNVVNQCDYGYPIPLYTDPQPAVPDVDALAQEIRRVDGNNTMGAGALAEHIVEWLSAAKG